MEFFKSVRVIHCLFEKALTINSGSRVLPYVSCHQSYGIGVTWIDLVPFHDLSLLYVQEYLITFITVHHYLYVLPSANESLVLYVPVIKYLLIIVKHLLCNCHNTMGVALGALGPWSPKYILSIFCLPLALYLCDMHNNMHITQSLSPQSFLVNSVLAWCWDV